MSPSTQAKILRVLQEHEFERLGGTRTIRVDVRRDRRDQPRPAGDGGAAGVPRGPLLPPQRGLHPDAAAARAEGRHPALAMSFLRRFASELKKRLDGLDPDAQKLLMRYNWPGNIRELENAIERAALLAERSVAADDLRLGDAAQGGTIAARSSRSWCGFRRPASPWRTSSGRH